MLGICEQVRGRYPAAEAAWARVAPGAAYFHEAVLARLRLFHDSGRLAAAEQAILDAAADPRSDRTDLLVLLVPVYSETGRIDDAERLIEERWEHLNAIGEATQEQSIKLVRLHIELFFQAAVDGKRARLSRSGRPARSGRRPGLAGPRQSGRALGLARRGRPLARGMPAERPTTCPCGKHG